MDKAIKIARLSLALAGAFCLLSIGVLAWTWIPKLCIHADGVLSRLEIVESKAYATLSHLDDASKVWSDSSKDQASAVTELVQNANGAIQAAQGAADTAKGALSAIRSQADAVGPVLADSRTAIKSINTDLITLNQDEQSLNTILLDTDAQVKLSSAKVQSTLTSFQALSEQSSLTMSDVRKVSDHVEQVIDNPKKTPWVLKILPSVVRLEVNAAVTWFSAH